MITHADYLYEAERRKYEMAQSEHHRLVKQVSQRDGSLKKGYHLLLSHLGDLLVAWGYHLQTRFVVESKPSPSVEFS